MGIRTFFFLFFFNVEVTEWKVSNGLYAIILKIKLHLMITRNKSLFWLIGLSLLAMESKHCWFQMWDQQIFHKMECSWYSITLIFLSERLCNWCGNQILSFSFLVCLSCFKNSNVCIFCGTCEDFAIVLGALRKMTVLLQRSMIKKILNWFQSFVFELWQGSI